MTLLTDLCHFSIALTHRFELLSYTLSVRPRNVASILLGAPSGFLSLPESTHRVKVDLSRPQILTSRYFYPIPILLRRQAHDLP